MHRHKMIARIAAAIDSHERWRDGLRQAIVKGRCDMRSATAACDDLCEFGAWLHSPDLSDAVRADPDYRRAMRLHAEFHRCAGSVLAYVERDQPSAAQFIMDGEYSVRSHHMLDALRHWQNATQRVAPPPPPVLRRYAV